MKPTFRPTGTCRAPECLSQKEQLHKVSDAPLPFRWGWGKHLWLNDILRSDVDILVAINHQTPIRQVSSNSLLSFITLSYRALLFFFHSLSLYIYVFLVLVKFTAQVQWIYVMYPNKDSQILQILYWYQVFSCIINRHLNLQLYLITTVCM